MKKNKNVVFLLLLLLIIVGCFFPLYKVGDVAKRCGIFSIILFILYTFIAYFIYNSKYKKWAILVQIFSLVRFLSIWANIQDTLDIIEDTKIKIEYRYSIGFYLLLVGIFGTLIYLITNKDEVKKSNTSKKTKYSRNKVTVDIKKILK